MKLRLYKDLLTIVLHVFNFKEFYHTMRKSIILNSISLYLQLFITFYCNFYALVRLVITKVDNIKCCLDSIKHLLSYVLSYEASCKLRIRVQNCSKSNGVFSMRKTFLTFPWYVSLCSEIMFNYGNKE